MSISTAIATQADEALARMHRKLKRYLERGSPLRLGLKQVDPLIRQLTEYRDLIDRMTRSPE